MGGILLDPGEKSSFMDKHYLHYIIVTYRIRAVKPSHIGQMGRGQIIDTFMPSAALLKGTDASGGLGP